MDAFVEVFAGNLLVSTGWQERGHLLRLQGSGVLLWQFGHEKVKVGNLGPRGSRREGKPGP